MKIINACHHSINAIYIKHVICFKNCSDSGATSKNISRVANEQSSLNSSTCIERFHCSNRQTLSSVCPILSGCSTQYPKGKTLHMSYQVQQLVQAAAVHTLHCRNYFNSTADNSSTQIAGRRALHLNCGRLASLPFYSWHLQQKLE